MNLDSYSHGIGQSLYHVVLVPKYRKHVFYNQEVKKCCENLFRAIARKFSYRLISLKVQPDHLHMFIGLRPDQTISEMVQRFKGISARHMFQVFPDLEQKMWGRNLWSRGKFYRSVGCVTTKTIERYIQESQGTKFQSEVGQF